MDHLLSKKNKISNYFAPKNKTTMIRKQRNHCSFNKNVKVISYVKKNGSTVSGHNRCLKMHHHNVKTNGHKSVLKNPYNVIDSSVAFGLHLKDQLYLVRRSPHKKVMIVVPECVGDELLAKQMHTIELEKLVRNK